MLFSAGLLYILTLLAGFHDFPAGLQYILTLLAGFHVFSAGLQYSTVHSGFPEIFVAALYTLYSNTVQYSNNYVGFSIF